MRKSVQVIVLMGVLAGSLLAQDRAVLMQKTPRYPELLLKMGIGGTVKLNALVAADGTVKNTKIQGGNPMLGEVACGAVNKWKFAPAAQASTEPVEMTFEAKSATVRIENAKGSQ